MTNTLLPPRPPPARGAKNYSAASRRGDTSATAAAAIATSLSAAARRAILIPGDEKQVLLGKYQSSTLLKPSAPHHCRHRTATAPPRTVQSCLVRAWDRGAPRRHGPPSRFTGRARRRRSSWDGAGRSYPVSHSSKQVRCSTLLLHFLLSTQCCPHYMHSGQRLSIMDINVIR